MATRLYLLRHGEAESGGGVPDLERPLTATGADSAALAAATLARLGLRFEKGLTSPAVRAVQTAEIFWRALGTGELQHEATLSPGVEPESVEALLRSLTIDTPRHCRFLVVGHMPDLGLLLRHLTEGRVSAAVSFVPGGMARLDFAEAVRAKAGKLIWSLRPAELVALADANRV